MSQIIVFTNIIVILKSLLVFLLDPSIHFYRYFLDDINIFSDLKPRNENTKKKK